MTRCKIGAKLKEYRLSRGWSIADVAGELWDRYELDVSRKTIYGWENDQSFPRTETFLALCEMYRIERPYETFPVMPQQSTDFAITPSEQELLYQLRKHPELVPVIKRILET